MASSDTEMRELLLNPLSSATRSARKTLLLVAGIGLVMNKTGLVPTKITTLGVEFSKSDRNVLLRIVGAVVVYLLVTFVVYAWTDYVIW
jgi:hypothetical protein